MLSDIFVAFDPYTTFPSPSCELVTTEHRMLKALLFATILFTIPAFSAQPTPEELHQLQVKLMVETKIIGVPDWNRPSSDFKSDGDPNTLEIVFLKHRQDGPSHVSDDGEVIFLSHPSDREQQAPIEKAFQIRALRSFQSTQ
jgi:hypothetical protein